MQTNSPYFALLYASFIAYFKTQYCHFTKHNYLTQYLDKTTDEINNKQNK